MSTGVDILYRHKALLAPEVCAIDAVRAAICARLGLRDEAERRYRAGLEFCEAQRLPRDAELCRRGLADVGV